MPTPTPRPTSSSSSAEAISGVPGAPLPTKRRPGRVATIAGIEIYIHWSFGLLVAWIFASHVMQGEGVAAGLEGAAFIITIFGCVVLHELGHALMAKRFGVRTRDITLYPIGGMARLERIPEKPTEELLIAVAGPAVNVVIAAGLFAWLAVNKAVPIDLDVDLVGGPFLFKLLVVNLFMAGFNLIPAFPMDGGRVLRALLAMRLDYVRATQAAAVVGQTIAVVFGLVGLFGNWMLLFIALFVFVAASGEAHAVQTRSVLAGVPVRAAMMTQFTTLLATDPVSHAAKLLLAGSQHDFPVVADGHVVGILSRDALIHALADGPRETQVGTIATKDQGAAAEREMLDSAFARMQADGISSLPVLDSDGTLCGVLTLENVGEWLMVQAAVTKKPAA